MSTAPTITLARHGQTEWALAGKHTGRTDVPLTPKGEADAARSGARLAGATFAHVFSSPLSRARRTAELAGYQPVLEVGLLEWDYGAYEGLKTDEVRRLRPGWDLFRDGCPGGESPEDVAARVDALVARLRGLSGDALLFAHGHILRVLAARWVGQPVTFARALLLGTASVSVLGFDHHAMDEPAIVLWNDTRHLAPT